MKVYSKTRKSHYWNEDRFVNRKDFCIVIDGATPLKQIKNFNGAHWLSEYIKKNISRYKGSVKYRLSQLCKDAYRDLPLTVKSKEYLPSASVCWVEFSDKKISIGILGDCEVTAKLKSGKIIRFYDDRLSVLDKKAIEEMIFIAKEKNICLSDARKYINETLIKHRQLANEPNGYSALLPSLKADIKEKNYELEIEDLDTVYLYSDGFSQAFENLKIYSNHKEMFESINDISEEIKKIVRTSYSDRELNLYPRFKIIDDITVTKICFIEN